MTLSDYILAFLALLVFVVLWSVVMHIVANKIDTPQTWKPANPNDYDQSKGAHQYFSGSQDTYAELDEHIDSLISKWEQSRKTT